MTGATVFVISDLCLVTERPGWCAEAPGRRLLELVVSGSKRCSVDAARAPRPPAGAASHASILDRSEPRITFDL